MKRIFALIDVIWRSLYWNEIDRGVMELPPEGGPLFRVAAVLLPVLVPLIGIFVLGGGRNIILLSLICAFLGLDVSLFLVVAAMSLLDVSREYGMRLVRVQGKLESRWVPIEPLIRWPWRDRPSSR